MAVVSYVEEPQRLEVREFYDRVERTTRGLGVLNFFKVVAHSPQLLEAWWQLMTVALTGLQLSPRLRELAILRVFQLSGGEYGFAHHARIGRQVGLSDDEIAALREYETSGRFDELDRLALRYTDAVTALRPDAAEIAAGLRHHLSERELVELTFCIAHWNLMARFLQPLQVELEPALREHLPSGWRA